MSKVNRNAPKRARGSESTYTFMDFEKDFPDDVTCLDWLVGHLYPEGIFCPKCQRVAKHHRVKRRTCFECQFCGHQEYPLSGTIFQDSATSLKLWFHAMFLMAQTRCGISAKQMERELGVTYKTAWRMANKIRSLLGDEDTDDVDDMLVGKIEIDEAYWGPKDKWKHRKDRGGIRGPKGKTPILGMAQRPTATEPGRVLLKVLPDVTSNVVLPNLRKKVLPKSTIYTDEGLVYHPLNAIGFHHSRVNHSQEVYVAGDVHVNTIEGFWSLVRRGIGGVYHSVSTKWLQSYLDEYSFRFNNRKTTDGMFGAFLARIEKTV